MREFLIVVGLLLIAYIIIKRIKKILRNRNNERILRDFVELCFRLDRRNK